MQNKFWKNRKVLVTGHTGFKGSWLSLWLISMGARVCGVALEPSTKPNLFSSLNLNSHLTSNICDIRNRIHLTSIVKDFSPEIVFHLAAQPLVLESYKDPITTYETNVIGTMNLLQAARNSQTVKSIVTVSSDKCYNNLEWEWGYRETDKLGGFDPYSSSKACVEIMSESFRLSFLKKERIHMATVRTGNVIGGGDWSTNRLIPDLLRAFESGSQAEIRNPNSIRPWQHVLDPLSGYLLLAQKLTKQGQKFSEAWNFGPNDFDSKSVSWIADYCAKFWGNGSRWISTENSKNFHEANYLKLDISKAKNRLNWYPKWSIELALKKTIEWHQSWSKGTAARTLCLKQIESFSEFDMKG